MSVCLFVCLSTSIFDRARMLLALGKVFLDRAECVLCVDMFESL